MVANLYKYFYSTNNMSKIFHFLFNFSFFGDNMTHDLTHGTIGSLFHGHMSHHKRCAAITWFGQLYITCSEVVENTRNQCL